MSDYSFTRPFRRTTPDEDRYRRMRFSDRPEAEQQHELVRLFEAAEKGALVRPALQNDADPNTRDEITSQTPLMLATINQHIENVRALLEAGANPLTPNWIVVRDHDFLSIKDEDFVSMPGDIPLVPPLRAVIIGQHQMVQLYTYAQTIIPQEWHDKFRSFAARTDSVREARHNEQMKERGLRIGYVPVVTRAVDRLLQNTPA